MSHAPNFASEILERLERHMDRCRLQMEKLELLTVTQKQRVRELEHANDQLRKQLQDKD